LPNQGGQPDLNAIPDVREEEKREEEKIDEENR
jgi:hypothetical protein